MGGDGLLWLAAALAIAGVAVLRISWGRPARSSGLNLAGWGALAASLIAGGVAAGEWGVTISALVATGAALLALAVAALEPAGKVRRKTPRTNRRDIDGMAEGKRSGLLTFAIVGPLALGASVLLALAVRALIVLAGGAEADANVAVLATVPIAWPILAFALLMMAGRTRQLAWVLGIAALSAPFLMFQGATA